MLMEMIKMDEAQLFEIVTHLRYKQEEQDYLDDAYDRFKDERATK
jgi:hypothetical protein